MIKVGIVGATGYAGAELVRLLIGHGNVKIVWLASRSFKGQPFTDIYGNFTQIIDIACSDTNVKELADDVDLIFTATPQGYCAGIVNEALLSKCKIIDLSADFRIKDVKIYEKWYGIEHKSPMFILEAAYGLCEINRDKIRKARLIANPGCYTTCTILCTYPLVKEDIIDPDSLIIDAKSGTSGVGRSVKVPNLYCEVNESIKAYGVGVHRHTPEIEEQLGYAAGKNLTIQFTPHLVSMNRGILTSIYAQLTKEISTEEILSAYKKHFADEEFIRILEPEKLPETKWVCGSNFVDIGFCVDRRTKRLMIFGAIDNLIKGAAGQAVQNMNLLYDLRENFGLKQTPIFP
ncbi:MAG: N-acetyl-gamma-glutamyl-phosphate reductase [Eggerthellaceae bacterium]|nr:N-acetyl-gamma-glutamyl-phosphate reductase [Eggerthellaceae bacterium]